MSNATVDALGMCFSHIPLLVWLIASCDESYIRIGRSVYISAWASTLLVQLHWAMRRPRFVGRVTGRIPRFFYFAVSYENDNRQLGIRWQKTNREV